MATVHPERDHSASEVKLTIHHGLLVFISHSSEDAALAEALIDLLKSALGLVASQIRCSSVDGYRLPVGVNTESRLREEVNAVKVVVGLITPNSLASYFVMFELGARWGANLFLAPLLAGVKPQELSGPLGLLNAVSASNESQLHQLLGDVSAKLSLPLQNATSYVHHIARVKQLADVIPPVIPPPPKPKEKRPNLTVKKEVYLGTLYLLGEIWSRTVSDDLDQPVPEYQAIYAEIKNAGKQGEEVGPAYEVKAELVVGREEFTPLPWIDEWYNAVGFDFGTVRYVILAAAMPNAFPQLGDWRIVINHRDYRYLPGVKSMNFDRHLTRAVSEQKIKLNLLHVKSGTILNSFDGICRWTEGRGIPSIYFE